MNKRTLNELLDVDMKGKSLEELLEYLQLLTHELGNGTLTKLRKSKEECRDMAKRMGDLDGNLGDQ